MKRKLGGVLTAGLTAALVATAAQATSPEPRQKNCFPAGSSWQSWSAAENGDVLYLRVGVNDIYRVDLIPGSHVYKQPDYYLVNQVRGSNWICSALDLQLTLASHYGFRQPLFPTSMRKLTPADVAAIPKKDLPP